MKDNIKDIDGKWEFNEDVTAVFSDMLSRSIPGYESMRSLCHAIGRNFLDGGAVVDIGCSNGLAVERLVRENPREHFYLFDVSEPMLEACIKRYEAEIDRGQVSVMYNDLRDGIAVEEGEKVDLVVSCLTIQFTPIEYRQNILSDIYSLLRKGGALILVEKVLGNSAEIDNILVSEYYGIKRGNEYTEEQIRNKRKSLEGVLVPLTSRFNEHLLEQAGFKKVDSFWRSLNFCGWVAIK